MRGNTVEKVGQQFYVGSIDLNQSTISLPSGSTYFNTSNGKFYKYGTVTPTSVIEIKNDDLNSVNILNPGDNYIIDSGIYGCMTGSGIVKVYLPTNPNKSYSIIIYDMQANALINPVEIYSNDRYIGTSSNNELLCDYPGFKIMLTYEPDEERRWYYAEN